MTVLDDYIAGNATMAEVKAEVARQRQGMRKEQPPYKQPDLNDQKWSPSSIFREVTIALSTGEITSEEMREILA